MLTQKFILDRDAWTAWRNSMMKGETHFHITEPVKYPCTVVWHWSHMGVLHHTYVL
jgi:hypothetical protein